MKIIVYIVYRKENMKINNIELTEKEFYFLWTWLEDDLYCQKKNGFHHNSTIIKNLRSIVKKLKKENK